VSPDVSPEEFHRLGYHENVILGFGILEIACTVLYVIARTSVLGGDLLTGYLGGATATHVRVGDYSSLVRLFSACSVCWGSSLRDNRLRASCLREISPPRVYRVEGRRPRWSFPWMPVFDRARADAIRLAAFGVPVPPRIDDHECLVVVSYRLVRWCEFWTARVVERTGPLVGEHVLTYSSTSNRARSGHTCCRHRTRFPSIYAKAISRCRCPGLFADSNFKRFSIDRSASGPTGTPACSRSASTWQKSLADWHHGFHWNEGRPSEFLGGFRRLARFGPYYTTTIDCVSLFVLWTGDFVGPRVPPLSSQPRLRPIKQRRRAPGPMTTVWSAPNRGDQCQ